MIFLVVVALAVASVVALILYARWNYGILESMGVPVVKPSFILGSDPKMHEHVHHVRDMELHRKLGPVFGSYEGRSPHLYIADADLVRDILVKDSDNFRNKRDFNFGHEYINEMLDVLQDEKWRTLRNAMSPQFTTGKIRLMSDKINEAADDCVLYVDKNCEREKVFDAKKIFTALTTDVIARCAFGTKLLDPHDSTNDFVKMVSKLTGDTEEPNWVMPWLFAYPFLLTLAGIPLFPADALEFFGGVLKKIMDSRKSLNQRENDFVDCLNDLKVKLGEEECKALGITDTTLIAQAVLFLLAGFETTATTLTVLSYRLASHPEIQERLIAEIDAAYSKKGGVDHDTIMELPYLNACIHEALRMCPPLIRVERTCNKDWRPKNANWYIKKGVTVQFSAWAVNYDEKYWPDPYEFKPERFLPENRDKNNTYAFLSFGQGPHNCLGMRFAKEELNLVLAKLLRKFRFEPSADMKLKFKPGRLFLAQYEPVMVKVVRRGEE